MNTFKPDGYNSVSPYFIVDDPARLIRLLQAIFPVQELRRFDLPNGQVMHAELRIDDSVIMLSQATEHYPANKFLMHVYVPDAREVYQKALDAGCKGLQEPVQKDDPDLRGMFEDFAGNVWAVGTQVGYTK